MSPSLRRGLIVWIVAMGAPVMAGAASVPPIELPAETTSLAAGPNRDAAEICVACHSADYIATQPRNLADQSGFWRREVTKMRRAFGAPIDEHQAALIVTYLLAAYPDPEASLHRGSSPAAVPAQVKAAQATQPRH